MCGKSLWPSAGSANWSFGGLYTECTTTLFNVYMDSLSTSLNSTNIGGHIGGQLLNHLCYADDLCLISMSFSRNATLVKYL